MPNDTTTERDTHTCDCKVCNGLTITTRPGYITGTPKNVRIMVHNYVQAAHARGGVQRVMADRAGIVAVDA